MILSIVIFLLLLSAYKAKWLFLSERRTLTNLLKYIMAILVVNGHLLTYHTSYSILAHELNIGYLCVSMFLFFSGYGLMYSWSKKGDSYLKDFIKKRLGRVIIPLMTTYAITLPIYYFIMGDIDWRNVLLTITWGGPYLQYSWYVTVIILLYLIFYVSAKYSKNKERCLIFNGGGIIVLAITFLLTKQPAWYIYSLPAFFIGLCHQVWEAPINHFLSGDKRFLIVISFLIFVLSFRWDEIFDFSEELSRWRYVYCSFYVSSIFFVIIMTFIINRMRVPWIDKIKIGKGSILHSFYEVYLIQNACAILLKPYIHIEWLYVLSSLFFTIIVAWGLYLFNMTLSKVVLK